MKTLRNCVLLLIVGVIVGYLLLCLVWLLPSAAIKQNVAESVSAFENSAPYESTNNYRNGRIDTHSEADTLEIVSYDGDEGVFDKAINAYRMQLPGEGPRESLILTSHSPELAEQAGRISYARYWHGSLVVLRPLFSVMNYQAIRNVNLVALSLLVAVLTLLLCKKKPVCVLPFLLTAVFFVPRTIGMTLHFSSIVYVMLFATLAVLLGGQKLGTPARYVPFFLLVGMLTSYVDRLTSPTITLTVPLFFWYVCICRDTHATLSKRLGSLLLCCVGWGAGYLLFWAGKWLIAYAFMGREALADALGAVTFRMSSQDERALADAGIANRIATLFYNIRIWLYDPIPTTLLAFSVIVLAFSCIKRKIRASLFFTEAIPYAFLCLIPVLWILLTCNHASVHAFFVYRNLAPWTLFLLSFLGFMAFGQTDAALSTTPKLLDRPAE